MGRLVQNSCWNQPTGHLSHFSIWILERWRLASPSLDSCMASRSYCKSCICFPMTSTLSEKGDLPFSLSERTFADPILSLAVATAEAAEYAAISAAWWSLTRLNAPSVAGAFGGGPPAAKAKLLTTVSTAALPVFANVTSSPSENGNGT